MDDFEELFSSDGEWLNRVPEALTAKLALLEDSRIDAVAKKVGGDRRDDV